MSTSRWTSHAVMLCIAVWRATAMPCTMLQVAAPTTVEDTSGAYQLAQAVNCSGGSFDLEWVGRVKINQPIRVGDGTTLRITAASSETAIVDGGSETYLFEVVGGTLQLSNLTLTNGSASVGAAVTGVDSHVTATRCIFVDNAAHLGGGMSLHNSIFEAEETAFVSNSAVSGGAIYSHASTVTTRYGTMFENNTASEMGGALWSEMSSIHVPFSTFSGNTADDGGGIFALNSDMEADNTTFIGNAATTRGGAIYASSSAVVLTNESYFVENVAALYGGAVYAEKNSSIYTVGAIVFERNAAEFGGATFLQIGMLYLDGYVHFANNFANVSGGAVYGTRSDIHITGIASFSANQASFGAGIRLFYLCALTVSRLGLIQFQRNVADEGAGLWMSQKSNLTVHGSCLCELNRASHGAGLVIFDSLALFSTGSNSIFYNNSAASGAGILLMAGAEVIIDGNSTFAENRAAGGAGIMARETSDLTITGDVSMAGNVASTSGGAIYIYAPNGFRIKGVQFVGNKASQTGGAIAMFSTGEISAYSSISGCGFAANEADDAGGALFIAGGFVKVLATTFEHNRAERAGGGLLVSGNAILENCVLEHNEARVGPGIYNTVSVTLESTDVCDNKLLCDDGNFLDWNLGSRFDITCAFCRATDNTCTMPHNNTVQLCEPVLEHTTSLLPDGTLESLHVLSGYWRISNTSRDIRECYEPAACVGGTQDLCASGYEGPFCAVCADGYAHGLGYSCVKCSEHRRTATLAVVIGVLLVAATLAIAAVCLEFVGSSSAETMPSLYRGRCCIFSSRFRWNTASQALKIIIITWQIVTQFAAVTSTIYPAVYATFLGWVDVVNLNMTWILSAGCLIDSSFYHSLLVSTVGPLGVAGIVLVSHAVRCRKCHADDPEARAKINHQHALVLFWTTFLIYSTVSTSIFQTFVCDHIDNGRSFLRADHSLECYTSTHKAFMAYAGVMVVVYPIGIPALYARVLYRSRNYLEAGQGASTAEAAIARELWAPYRPEVYYYEVLECLRRGLLSGAVVLVFPNSAGQVATSVLLAILSAAVLMALGPYSHRSHTWMARISHAVVILSMYVALLQKVDDFTDDGFNQHVFAFVLLALNCSLILAVGVEALGMCSVAVLEIREPVAANVGPNKVERSSSVRRSFSVLSARVEPCTEMDPTSDASCVEA